MKLQNSISNEPEAAGPDWLSVVREQVKGLRYGIVQIVVHDSNVVQVERTEKLRLDQRRQPGKGGDVY